MISISLRFSTGRFHATPWNRHVNEGVPEWPPSPWRILRSIIFNWKTKNTYIEKFKIRFKFYSGVMCPPVPILRTSIDRNFRKIDQSCQGWRLSMDVCWQ